MATHSPGISRSATLARRVGQLGAMVLALRFLAQSSLAQSPIYIYQEGFESNGEGTRYTSTGFFKSEAPHNPAVVGNAADFPGPVFWARRSDVSIVGIAGATPARRAMLTWNHNIDAAAVTQDVKDLISSTIRWLLKDRTNATVLFSPPAAGPGDQLIQDLLTAAGHTIVDDDGVLTPNPAVHHLVIKSSSGNFGSSGRFAATRIPLLTYNGQDHDDILVCTIGDAAQLFQPGTVTMVGTNHPAAGGKTGSFQVVTSEQPFDVIGTTLPERATIIASYTRQVPYTVESLAKVDALVDGTVGSIKTTNSVAQADFSDAAAGVWPFNNIPAGLSGGENNFAVVGKGQLQVTTAGTYSFALGVDDGARLQIDRDRNGLSASDTVITLDGTGAFRWSVSNVTFAAVGTYDFEWVSFDSTADYGAELAVYTIAGGTTNSPGTDPTSWELVGDHQPGSPVKLTGTITTVTYVGIDTPVPTPYLVVLEDGADGGLVLSGGPFFGSEGTNCWGGAALNKFDVDGTGTPKTLRLQPVDVTGRQNLKLTLAAAATFLDFERTTGPTTGDYLDVWIDTDGIGPNDFVQLIQFTAPSGSDKYFDDRATKPDNPTRLRLQFQDVTYDIPAGATQLIIEFRAFTTWYNEIVAFDNIRVTEGTTVVQPRFDAPTITGGSVRIAWTGGGRLQESTNLSSWSVLTNAPNPHLVTPGSAPYKFYRIVTP